MDNIPRNNRNRRRKYRFDYENYDEEQFRSRFRLMKDGCRTLLDMLRHNLSAHNERGRPIPANIQLLLTLRFYAMGTFQLACGDLCDISQPSASRILKRVSGAIARLKNQYIVFPPVHILPRTKLDFWRIGGLPRVVGAIDCTHIKIPCPEGVNAELFRNHKGYFSINVQAVCGPNLEIQNIVARWPGTVHDARMFNNSRLCAQFERGDIDGMLLSDSGYPCRQYLMTPLADPQTQPERRYMYKKYCGRDVWRMEDNVSMFINMSTNETRNDLHYHCHNSSLVQFCKKSNDPIYEPANLPPAEDELPAVHAGE